MDAHAIRRFGVRMTSPAAAFTAGILALVLLAGSVENSAQFSRWQPWILLVNILGAIALMVLLARKFWQLYRDFRDHVPGSRLAMRTVLMFGALVIAPLVIVYLFSLDFINRGIDSWFRVEIKQGLNDAVVLSRSALDLRLREQARRTDIFARSLRELQGPALLQRLDEERRATEAKEITVYDAYGRAAAVSSGTPLAQQPAPSPPEVALQLAAGRQLCQPRIRSPNGAVQHQDRLRDRRRGVVRMPKPALRADSLRGTQASCQPCRGRCSAPRRSTVICRCSASR